MFDFPDFLTLVNKALIAEREHKLLDDNKPAANDHKRKFEPKKDMQLVQKGSYMATDSGGVQTQLAAERQQDYYTSQECRDQPGARRLPAQQFVLQLWSNRTLRPTVSQEHQARHSISAASQLHGAVFRPRYNPRASSSHLRR